MDTVVLSTSEILSVSLDVVEDEIKNGNFEEAVIYYSKGIKVCNPYDNKEILIKILLNKALCSLKLRSYDDVVKDCSNVLIYDKSNIKGLIRRATAYEYMGEFSKGLIDIRQIFKEHQQLPLSLQKPCNDLMLRLSKYDRIDSNIQNQQPLNQLNTYSTTNGTDTNTDQSTSAHSDSTSSKGKLVSEEQCLRINILEFNLDQPVYSMNYTATSKPIPIPIPIPLHIRICIGNEFGLWNQQYMSIGESNTINCSSSRGSGSGSSDSSTGSGSSTSSIGSDGDVQVRMKCSLVDLSKRNESMPTSTHTSTHAPMAIRLMNTNDNMADLNPIPLSQSQTEMEPSHSSHSSNSGSDSVDVNENCVYSTVDSHGRVSKLCFICIYIYIYI